MSMEDKIKKRAEAIGKEPAYPNYSNINDVGSEGITKFELFATNAMKGLLGGFMQAEGWFGPSYANEAIAQAKALCYALAEAEMKEVSNG